jgi:hypothetical protein
LLGFKDGSTLNAGIQAKASRMARRLVPKSGLLGRWLDASFRSKACFKDGSTLESKPVFEDGLTLGSELGFDEGSDDGTEDGLTLCSKLRLQRWLDAWFGAQASKMA